MDKATRHSLIQLIRDKALSTGRFVLAGGGESDYYLDCRNVTLTGEGAHVIGTAVCSTLSRYDVDAIGGMTMGADPIVGAALMASAFIVRDGWTGFLVRKEPKGHGTRRLVEGPVRHGDRVAIIEDVTTTGGSALRAIEAVQELGCKVVVVVSLVDRLEGAAEMFARRGITFHPLLTIRDLGLEPVCDEPAEHAA